MARLSEKMMSAPRFDTLNDIANQAVIDAARRAGFGLAELSKFDVQAGRVVDDLTSLLFRMAKQSA